MKLSKQKFLYYFPRIGGLVYVFFLLLFSFDVFGEAQGFWQTAGLFLLHSIPSIILFTIVMVAWKHELVGTIAFLFFGIGYSVFAIIKAESLLMAFIWMLTIALPPILIGLCFLRGYLKKKRK